MGSFVGVNGNSSQGAQQIHSVDGHVVVVVYRNDILVIRKSLIDQTTDHLDVIELKIGVGIVEFYRYRNVFRGQSRLQQVERLPRNNDTCRIVRSDIYSSVSHQSVAVGGYESGIGAAQVDIDPGHGGT